MQHISQTDRLRWLSICALLVGWLPIAAFGEELEFPYTAFVLGDGTPVRSGPAELHYPTQMAQQGDQVEVHRHDPGGWAAIRPPGGSFSLVPASAIEMIDDRIGRVSGAGTQAWVGTREGAVEQPLWQVRLEEQEEVEVLGEVSWPSPEGHSTIWYQIAPPAGEFRWVRLDALRLPSTAARELPADESVARGASDLDAEGWAEGWAEEDLSDPLKDGRLDREAEEPLPPTEVPDASGVALASYQAVVEEKIDENEGWRPATHRLAGRAQPIPGTVESHPQIDSPGRFLPPGNTMVNHGAGSVSPGNAPPRIASRDAETLSRSLLRSAPTGSNSAAVSPIEYPTGPLGSRLKQIELALSQEMVRPPVEWRLSSLRLELEKLRGQATQPAERAYADRLAVKLNDCERLRNQYRQFANGDPKSNTLLGSGMATQPVGTGVDPDVEFGTTYDAYGWLNELTQANGAGEPAYVLQDENGRITHHVTPAPGLNLRRYLKTRVGILGNRGFHQGYQLDHVTAERVVELSRLR